MAYSTAATVEEYLAEQTPERREAMETMRKLILDNLPPGFEEIMQFGMIGYVVPLERYPDTYNKQAIQNVALASQKNYISIYLMNIYGDPETAQWFEEEFRASGKKLNMGKCCVRFKRPEDLPLDLIGQAVARTSVEGLIEIHEMARASRRR